MIYLDNSTSGQTIYIPRNDLNFIPQKPTDLEGKKVTIDRDITYVYPSSGFIGMSSVTINAEAYAQRNYDDGFDDGFLDGMSSGYTDGFNSGYTSGETHQKSLLVSTAFTENGTYTREDGWNEVEVVVPQTGISIPLSSITIDNNTAITVYDKAYTAITVNVDTASTYQSGYTSGHTDGEDAIISTFTAFTATTNGEYGSSANPYSSVTVNVPQTGTSIPLSSITITENTAITETEKAYSAITVNVPQTGHTDQELEEAFESGYTSGHTEGMNDQKQLLTTTAFTENGSYQRENGWSGITVNVDTASTYNSGYESGHTDGVSEEKAKLSGITFTANTAVTLNDGGYSAVTVNVAQTGHTDQEITEAYNSGYTSGETHQKSLLSTTAFTENGTYSNENGWSGVTVNLDTASTYNNGYTSGYSSGYTSGYTDGYGSGYTSGYTSGHTSGYTDGQNNIIGTFSAYTATTNGQYGSSAHPLSAITVNVPTGSSATLGEGSFSANGTYSASTDNLDGYSAITINVPTGGSVNIETGKTVSYNTNGTYTIEPMSSYTEYEKTQTMMDEDIFYFTAHTYPSSGVFRLAKVVDRNGGGYAEVLYQNGHITGTSYFPLYSCNIYAFSDVRLQVFPSSEFDCYVEELSGYSMVYDAMSSITVNVNVPQQGDSSFIEYIEGPATRVLTVPETTTTIRDGAFYNQTYFTGLTLPNSLTGIGASSFYGCSALSINNFTIPSGVTSIGYQAFYGCSGLTGSVKLSNKNDESNIGNNAFQKCSSITGITLTGYTNFGNDVFKDCSNFKTITNSHYVKAIGATCFVGTDLTGRIGLSDVTSIGNGAFYGLTKLISFAVGDKIETIPTNLCNGCTALTAANMGSGVTQINSNAFANCTSLEELYFYGTTPPNVANVNAFSNIASVGYLYHKAGTDYTDFKNTYLPSGWFDMPTL